MDTDKYGQREHDEAQYTCNTHSRCLADGDVSVQKRDEQQLLVEAS